MAQFRADTTEEDYGNNETGFDESKVVQADNSLQTQFLQSLLKNVTRLEEENRILAEQRLRLLHLVQKLDGLLMKRVSYYTEMIF